MGKKTLTKTVHFTFFALLLAIGLTLHYLESFLSFPIAGFMLKIGLSNIVIVYVLIMNSDKDAILMSLSKVTLALFFSPTSNFGNFLISLSGAITSLLIMMLAKRIGKNNIIAISILGGIFHNLGQVLAVIFLLRISLSTKQILNFIPYFVFLGSISGFVIGLLTNLVLSKLSNIPKKSDYNI